MTATTAPTTIDTRRISELDPDYQRLHAITVRKLRQSLARYARELRSGTRDPQHVASDFITRHIALLSTSYQQAHREGQRDWYAPRSLTPDKWIKPPRRTKLRQRLAFYAAASVAKMAREGMQAAQAAKAQLSEAPVTLDEDALDEWLGGTGIRLELQGQLTWTGLQDGYSDAGDNDPANPYRWLFWDLEPLARHCEECPAFAEGSPYDPPWIPGGNILTTVPGAGATACGAGCHCSLRYGSAAEAGSVNNWKLYQKIMRNIADTGIVPPAFRDLFPSAQQDREPPDSFRDSMTGLFEPETVVSYSGALGSAATSALQQDPLYQQTAAQDAYRSIWDKWDVARGNDLPPMPRLAQMFSESEQSTRTVGQSFDITRGDGISFEQFIDMLPMPEDQTPEQRKLLRQWVDVLLWLGGRADGETTDEE